MVIRVVPQCCALTLASARPSTLTVPGLLQLQTAVGVNHKGEKKNTERIATCCIWHMIKTEVPRFSPLLVKEYEVRNKQVQSLSRRQIQCG